MNRKRLIRLLLLTGSLVGLVLAVGTSTALAARSQLTLITVNIDGLDDLGSDFMYEGWAIVNGNPISSGTFSIDGDGNLSQHTFAVQENPRLIDAFVLTIEPYPDSDPAPSDTHVLAGNFNGRRANLSAGHPAALGNDFSGANGRFILAVPSDSSTSYTNGIWWLDPAAGPGPGLDLPTLPAGWVYEGWVVDDSGPISTGTFTDVTAADSDAGGATAGADPTPPFPGQDFVNPPTNLVGHLAVISIEPYPDNSPAPFAFKPLVDEIEDTGAPGITQEMANNAAAFATGTATLSRGARFQVTLENLTGGQPFSPPVAATHRLPTRLFAVGTPASDAVEAIAEDGNQGIAVNALQGDVHVTAVVDIGMPLTPHGTTVGDFTDTVTFEIIARPGDRLSLATMLICTNDGFVGADGARLPRHGTLTYVLNGYDAGTEDNTELSSDLVDPCSLLGPVVLNGDPNGNEDTAVDTNPAASIQHHPGIAGAGDLLAAHNWNSAPAQLTITRID